LWGLAFFIAGASFSAVLGGFECSGGFLIAAAYAREQPAPLARNIACQNYIDYHEFRTLSTPSPCGQVLTKKTTPTRALDAFCVGVGCGQRFEAV
jgi:hypothetical protein